MKRKALFLLLTALITCARAKAQYKIAVAKEPPEAFAFTKHWDYAWYMVRTGNGKFENTEGDTIAAKDTAHLYFTANCRTSVQGGYKIRYCSANRTGNKTEIIFSDGLPGYANEYRLEIIGNQFFFKPTIVYPSLQETQGVTCTTTASCLTLYQKNYRTSRIISGYIGAAFTESVAADASNKKITRKHFLKGYFKTSVNLN